MDDVIIKWVFYLSGSYLIGSINFSILMFHLLGQDDPREGHSGNPGVTNVYRQAGLVAASAVLILDVGRAALIAIVGKRLLPGEQVPWLGLALIAGNRLPCFHGFRGGKGVANTLGFTLGYAPLWATASALAWLTARTFVSTSFITSFVMLGILTTGMIVQGGLSIHATTAASVICLVVAAAHRKNIREFMDSLK